MTREEAIKLLVNATYSNEWQGNEDLTTAHNMAIEALEIVEEFEKAQIISSGRLNGRTYAYKCGLEDGKRKALEQEEYYKDLAQSYEKTIVKLAEAVTEQQPNEDCVSRQALINAFPISDTYTLDDIIATIKFQPPVTPTQRWIPVSERLPKEMGTYMTTIDYGEHGLVTGQRYYYGRGLKWNDECVIAWTPLPEPYKAEMESE